MQLSKAIGRCPDADDTVLDALAAKRKELLHLEVSRHDAETPEYFFAAAGAYVPKALEYAPYQGLSVMTEAVQSYYRLHGMNFSIDDILITNGASEALSFALSCILDPGCEVLVPEPFAPGYRTMITAAGGVLRPVFTTQAEGYRYVEKLEALIGNNTRAILCDNPGNPTGVVLTPEEMDMLADLAERYDLWLIADESCRDFFYGDTAASFGQLPKLKKRLILLDSASHRFAAYGARVGALLSKNEDFMAAARKLARARFAVATLEQVAAAELYLVEGEHLSALRSTLKARRDACLAALTEMGAEYVVPQGGFCVFAHLPVDDTRAFLQWVLESFHPEGAGVLLAPGDLFYQTPGCGRHEARICFALEATQRAMPLLKEALAQYPNHS